MILDSLKLTNIRSHKKTSITFPKGGITLFHGDIGSGKSTILMGIEFALFGLGSSKGDSLLAKSAESGEVMLEFHVGDTRYEVGRTLKRTHSTVTQNSKDSYLRVDGVSEPLTAKQLRVRILDILGLNEPTSANSKSRIYRYAVFTPQDEMKVILSDSVKRFETIRKIFRMEDYQTAIKNTDALKSAIRDRMNVYATRSESLDQKRSELKSAIVYVSEMQSAIKTHTDKEYSLISQEKKAKSNLAIYETRMQEKSQLDVRLASITSDINHENLSQDRCQKTITDHERRLVELQNDHDSLSKKKKPTSRSLVDIESDIARFTAIHGDVIQTRSDIASAQKQLDNITARLTSRSYSFDDDNHSEESIQDNIESNRATSESFANDLQGLRLEHEKTNNNKIRASQEGERLKKSISDLQGLGAKCNVCGHILTKEHLDQQREERQRALQNIESELASLESEYTKQSSAMCGIEDRQSSLQDETRRLEALLPDVAEHRRISYAMQQDQVRLKKLDSENVIPRDSDFDSVVSAAVADNDNIASLRTPVEYLRALKDALAAYEHSSKRADEILSDISHNSELKQAAQQDLKNSLERTRKLESDYKDVSAQIQTYAQDSSAKKEIQDELDVISESLRDTRASLSACRANFETKNSRIKELESDIKSAEKWQKKYHKCNTYLNWLGDFFVPSVSQIEKSVMLSLQHAFNTSYNKWYSQLIDDPTKDSRIDEEFAPIVEQDGFSQSVEYLSGGEKTSIALSYRLALNYTMRRQTPSLESNLLILDEPTDGLSSAQLENVRDLLYGLESKQIILVSHDHEMISHMDYAFKVTKTTGVTTVTQIKSAIN